MNGKMLSEKDLSEILGRYPLNEPSTIDYDVICEDIYALAIAMRAAASRVAALEHEYNMREAV